MTTIPATATCCAPPRTHAGDVAVARKTVPACHRTGALPSHALNGARDGRGTDIVVK